MTSAELGVRLPSDTNTSASALLHTLLCKACEHLDELKHVKLLPESRKGFRDVFPEMLPAFEAARIASKNPSAITRRIALEAASSLVYRSRHAPAS